MKKTIQLRSLLWAVALLFAGRLAAQCPQPLNILVNPSFDNVGAPCAPLPPNTISNGAFNRGCVPGWAAANTTPSICNGAGNLPAPPIGSGPNYACLGSNTEGIFQNLVICQGERYQITLSHRGGSFQVYMAQNLQNVPLNDPQAFAIDMVNWQLVATVNGAANWQQNVLPIFTANNLANNQLLILHTGGGDIFLDNMSMVCISQITPFYTVTEVGGGQFNFAGNSNAMPPMAVVNWCWDFGDGNTATGQNVSHTYQNGGTYTVCLTIQDNCCFCLNDTCMQVIYDPCACGTNPQVLNGPPGTTVNWSGLNQEIGNDVIITPGTHLTVTGSTLRIKNPCKFIVMRGASMRVNSSTLTSACAGQTWDGIIVWGNSAVNHGNPGGVVFNTANPVGNSLNAPGVLTTSLGSVIERMSARGVSAQRDADNPVNEAIYAGIAGTGGGLGAFTGGFVQSNSTTFRDNLLSAQFRDYPFNNLSNFGSCTFTRTNPPADLSAIGPEGVRIWNTDNISFLNCNFNQVGARGIVTVDGSLTMRRCTLNRHFNGLRASSAGGQTGFVQVGVGVDNQRNRFLDNRFGIWSDGIFNLEVQTNTFQDNGDLVTIGNIQLFQGAGIFVSGPSAFNIIDNDFTNNITGVNLLNTGGSGNNGQGPNQRLQCNVHQQDRTGILVQGRCPGMTFRDNDFNNISADLILRPQFFTPGQIHLNQGQSNAAVFNLFSVNATDVFSSQAPNQTILFNYFPPFTENQVVFERTAPDCDINGVGGPIGVPCNVTHNFLNMPRSFGVSDACLTLPPGYTGCPDRSCLDNVRSQKIYLEGQVSSGQLQYSSQLASTKLRFDTDRLNLTRQWYNEGNMALVVQTLTTYGTSEDLQLLYGYYLRARDFASAESLLNSLSTATTDDADFKSVQNIYLRYARSSGAYMASAAELQSLQNLATQASTPGGMARATYYLMTGTWIDPTIDPGTDGSGGGLAEGPSDRGQVQPADENANTRIVPNPANDQVSVAHRGDGVRVRVLNAQGALVQEMLLQSGVAVFETGRWPAGVYAVQILGAEGRVVETDKLLVLH